jgi:hypothetical protein
MIWGRPPAPVGQTIEGSIVFGDVIQVSDIGGDVTIITADRPPYRVDAFGAAAVPLSPERARAQPSRLLLARHQAVPFVGRDEQLSELANWMTTGDALSVRLLHASGGRARPAWPSTSPLTARRPDGQCGRCGTPRPRRRTAG